jgi:hypothetical protein
MSRIVIVILIYRRHKHINLINTFFLLEYYGKCIIGRPRGLKMIPVVWPCLGRKPITSLWLHNITKRRGHQLLQESRAVNLYFTSIFQI